MFPNALDRWNQISRQMYPWSRYAFTALFTLLVVVVMLNLLVSLLNDLYEELKTLAKADWCRAQVGHCTAPFNDTIRTTRVGREQWRRYIAQFLLDTNR